MGCGCSLSIAHTKHDLANGYHHLILSESERIRLVVTISKHPKISTARTGACGRMGSACALPLMGELCWMLHTLANIWQECYFLTPIARQEKTGTRLISLVPISPDGLRV